MSVIFRRPIRFGGALAVVFLASGLFLRANPQQPVGTWASMGSLADARTGAAAVALDDGRTLIAGGVGADGAATASVLLYDPLTNAFVAAGELAVPRAGHTATRLEDGRIAVAGGTTAGLLNADIEIFDPATGSSSVVASMAQPRTSHAAARLPDGDVLLVGGTTLEGVVLQSAERFDPVTFSVTPAGSGLAARTGASATALIDGRVLIAGGSDGVADLDTAEIFDGAWNSFTAVGTRLSVPRSGHTAVFLPHNAGVLIAGGTSNGAPVSASDLFLPAQFPDPFSFGDGSFAPTGAMTTARSGAVGGPAGDAGYAFVAGGGAATAEAYRYATIMTDKDDYAPGEPAIITGSGWQPGETVTLLFQEDPAVHPDYVLQVVADRDGNIYWDQWAPEWHDLGVRFYLLASDSRSKAQTTFTDAVNAAAVETRNATCTTAQSTFDLGTTVCARVGPVGIAGLGNNDFRVQWIGPSPSTTVLQEQTFTSVANGSFHTNTFTPSSTGTYTVRTLAGSSGNPPALSTATFTVNAPANTAPTADAKNVPTLEDTPVEITLTGSDAQTCELTFAVVASPSNGSLSAITGQTCVPGAPNTDSAKITYTPDPDFNGADSFTYKVTDGGGLDSSIVTVSISVTAVNDEPTANPQSVTFLEDSTDNLITLTGSPGPANESGQTLTFILNSLPSFGTLSQTSGGAAIAAGALPLTLSSPTLYFTPTPDYCTTGNTFNVHVQDDGGTDNGGDDTSPQATISVTVTCVNDKPTANAQSPVVDEDSLNNVITLTGSPGPANESGQTLTFILNSLPSFGTLSQTSGGAAIAAGALPLTLSSPTLYFTPTPDYCTTGNTFNFHVTDDGGTDNGGVDTSDQATVSITVTCINDAPVPTNDGPVTTQYSDPISNVTISATDIDSPGSALSASTGWKLSTAAAFTPGLPSSLTLSGPTSNGGTIPGSASWTLSGKMYEAPGVYIVRVTVSDGEAVNGSAHTDVTITVTRENARATYTGLTFFSSGTGTSAVVTLSATVEDATNFLTTDPFYDEHEGDIRKARVSFLGIGTVAACQNLVPSLVNPGNTKVGTVSCTTTLANNVYDITVTTGQPGDASYYRGGTSEPTPIVVAPSTTGFITGGGFLINTSPAGTYAGALGFRTNFGFNVKYNKAKTNLQGQVSIIVRAPNGKKYQIKSNAISSMTASLAKTGGGTAEFTGKANITDITDPDAPVPITGNGQLVMTLNDKGEPGTQDTIGFTLWNGNQLWFSSNWDGIKTIEQVIAGGNLQVR